MKGDLPLTRLLLGMQWLCRCCGAYLSTQTESSTGRQVTKVANIAYCRSRSWLLTNVPFEVAGSPTLGFQLFKYGSYSPIATMVLKLQVAICISPNNISRNLFAVIDHSPGSASRPLPNGVSLTLPRRSIVGYMVCIV